MKKIFTLAALCLSFAQDSFAQCTADILQTGPLVQCQGSTIALSATTGGVSYQWYKNNIPIPGANFDSYTETSLNAGSFDYTVDIDFGTCTDVSDALNVVINPTPNVTASSNSPICVGETLNLQSSYVTVGTIYVWNGPNLFSSSAMNPTLSNAQLSYSGTYTLNASLASTVNGTSYVCNSLPVTTMVMVNPIPVITSFTSNSPVCSGETIQFQSSGTVGTNYNITGPSGYTSNFQNPNIPNAQLVHSGPYYIVAASGNCVSQPETTTVVVNPSPYIANSTYTDPTYPNTSDGMITINGLIGGQNYVVEFFENGIYAGVFNIIANISGTLVITGLSEGIYSDIMVYYNGCPSNTVGPFTLVAQNPLPDDVWPGDANDDHWADNNDVLDLGLAYGATGTQRIGASLNWIAQTSTDWGSLQTNGAEMKHADCDGDGIVDANDQTAITQNYGLYHAKGVHIPQAKSASLPDLYFDLTGITFTAGTTVTIPIKLGTSSLPMNNILGIAAKIKVQDVILDNAPAIDNNISWIGNNTSGSAMNFYKEVTNNQTDWALVRTDHNDVSGEGTIAAVTIQIPATSSGDAILYFENVKIINTAGQEITDYNVVDDTATIIPLTLNNATVPVNKISVIPNPSEGQAELQVTSSENAHVYIHITDILGREVWKSEIALTKGTNNIPLPTQLASGVYTIRTNGITTRAVKWLRK